MYNVMYVQVGSSPFFFLFSFYDTHFANPGDGPCLLPGEKCMESGRSQEEAGNVEISCVARRLSNDSIVSCSRTAACRTMWCLAVGRCCRYSPSGQAALVLQCRMQIILGGSLVENSGSSSIDLLAVLLFPSLDGFGLQAVGVRQTLNFLFSCGKI